MSAVTVRLTESLHKYAKKYAGQEGLSVSQLISTALAEKLLALATEDLLELRAKGGSRRKFDAALAKGPDVTADARDRK